MIRVESKVHGIERICRYTLAGGLLTAIAVAQIGASATPLAASAGGSNDRIVVVHSDDQAGMNGLALTKSCLRQSEAMSEQKPIDGAQSVLLIMKYDNNGKIIGVQYGEKDVCKFLQTTPEKLS